MCQVGVSARARGARIANKMGLESQEKDKLLKIIIDSPGSWIELGTVTLFLRDADDHEQNTMVNLSSTLKIKKALVLELLKHIEETAIELWFNKAEVEESIRKGDIPELLTVYSHPLAGYFEISGGGMSSGTMSFISKEVFEQRTKHGEQ